MVMQNTEGKNKVHYGLYESSDYKRCKACVKLNYLTDNLVPRSPKSCAGLRNEDYATDQLDVLRRVH